MTRDEWLETYHNGSVSRMAEKLPRERTMTRDEAIKKLNCIQTPPSDHGVYEALFVDRLVALGLLKLDEPGQPSIDDRLTLIANLKKPRASLWEWKRWLEMNGLQITEKGKP